MKQRGFTPAELSWAMRLHSQGKKWKHIARSLGRANADGIRRQLDPAYRTYRNAYHVGYRRGRRSQEEPS